MLSEVKVGDPIKAQQYNDLIGALTGPNSPSNAIPFTQTRTGSVLNGGHTRYNTRESYHYNDFLSITYASGTLDDRYDCYDETDPDMNIFDGVWFQTPHFSKSEQYFYHSQFFGQPVETLLIDPTTDDDDLKLIWMLTGAKDEESGMWPLCEISSQASLGVFQIMECAQYTDSNIGRTIAIFGNWKKLDSGVEGWQAKDAFSGKETQLVSAIQAASPVLRGKLTKIRFVGQFPMYDNYDPLEETNYDLPPVAFNVGQQIIESLPDAAQDQESQLSATELSSIEFTPAHSWGLPSGNQATWGYSLFHFARYASDSISSVYDVEQMKYVPELSAYDVLMRHKHPHSKANSGNPYYGGQAEAVLEYIPLSSVLKMAKGDIRVDTTATNFQQCSIEKNDLCSDNEYYQIYNFHTAPQIDDILQLNVSFGRSTYLHKWGNNQNYPDQNIQLLARDSSTNVKVTYDGIELITPEIHASDVTDLETVISDYIHCECSCDLASIWAALSALSNDLSNYWKVGGTYNDNCYGESIGNSQAQEEIDLDNGQLLATSNDQVDCTVNWHACETYANGGDPRIDWANMVLYDEYVLPAITWNSRTLLDSGANTTVDWEHMVLWNPIYGGPSIDWQRGQMYHFGTVVVVDWDSGILYDMTGDTSVNWHTRTLSSDWQCIGGFTIINNQGNKLTLGSTSITEAQLVQLLALI